MITLTAIKTDCLAGYVIVNLRHGEFDPFIALYWNYRPSAYSHCDCGCNDFFLAKWAVIFA